ncbi:MAG: tetraacyldisaccharide 4'-kinase [Candidatus Rokubacteria bacterium]|nr:tetraacyldisaccharide 4'-kinase [Candidatus Rokubacteria bacterium]
MTEKRSSPNERLVQGWERGFSGRGGRALAALAGGYRGLLGAREWLYARGILRSHALSCPVVSVGNLTVGGTGKTPAVELAVRTLLDLGHRPAVVSRGYGRQTSGVQVVADPASIRLDAEDAGDEPFLLARRLPGVAVVVGSNRHQAARLALERFGATAIVLDDGFQHRTLGKDLEIVMARARNPWGNGALLPRGPLREPLSALRRADLVVATGARQVEDVGEVRATVSAWAPEAPVLAAAYAPTECWTAGTMRPVDLARLAGARLVAFAGIGFPAGFEQTLEGLGVGIEAFMSFGDHHWYSREDLAGLEARAATLGAGGLVTTEKDWVRLRRLPPPGRPLYIVGVRLELLDGHAAWRHAFEQRCPRK